MTRELQAKLFIYFLPVYYVYNMLLDVIFTRGSILGLIINIVLLFLLAYLSLSNKYNKKFWYIFAWIVFNLILIVSNSSKIIFSLTWFFKTLIGLLCFPLAFYLISGNKRAVMFLKMLMMIICLYMLNLLLANSFNWGNAYGGVDNDFAVQGGASIVTGSMPVVIALMMAPVIFLAYPHKLRFLIFWAISFVSVFLIFKRTNIAALLVGYFVIFIVYSHLQKKYRISTRNLKLNKGKIVLYIFGGIFFLSICVYVARDVIVAQYEVRARKFEKGELEKEGRYIEWELVNNLILESNDTKTVLFGKEPYNTPGNYGFQSDRNIHGDFSLLLFSTGLVGFLAYWGMQIFIACLILPYCKKRYLRTRQDILMVSIYIANFIIWGIFSFSAAFYYVILSSMYYMTMGMILRYFRNKHLKHQFIISNIITNESSNCSKL